MLKGSKDMFLGSAKFEAPNSKPGSGGGVWHWVLERLRITAGGGGRFPVERWKISTGFGSKQLRFSDFPMAARAGSCHALPPICPAVSANLPPVPPPGIALFDLDGTLIAWDCQLLFRHFVLRRAPWRGVLLPLFLAAAPFAGLLGSARMKRVFLSYLWRMKPQQLAALARDFAQSLMPAIYPELREKLEAHRAAGHFLILASASPECYVLEIGRLLGFDLALGTPVECGPLLPKLQNHKGAAKVTRLLELLPPGYFINGQLRHCHGFTDSRADLPMLTLCQSATVVNPSPALAALATTSGWDIVHPARPWTTRVGFALRALALLLGVGRDPAGLTSPP
jgi:phosphatidylglycerophosphatase C